MSNQSTPIENLQGRDNGDDEGENLTVAQQVLNKYNQMEQEPDADTERAELNQTMENRQLDPSMVNQHRMMEMQKAREFQLQQQQQQQQFQQQAPPPPVQKSFMNKIKDSLSNFGKQLKPVFIVILLLFVLGLPMVNKMMVKFIPKISNEMGVMNMKGLILKAILGGLVFYLLNTFIPL